MYEGRSDKNDSNMDHRLHGIIHNKTITIRFNLLMSRQGNVHAHGGNLSSGSFRGGSNNSVLLSLLTEEHLTLLVDKANWEEEKKILKERATQMKSGMTMSKQAR